MKVSFLLSFFIVSLFSQFVQALSPASIFINPLFENMDLFKQVHLTSERKILSYEDEVRRDAKTIFSLLKYKATFLALFKESVRLEKYSKGLFSIENVAGCNAFFLGFTSFFLMIANWLRVCSIIDLFTPQESQKSQKKLTDPWEIRWEFCKHFFFLVGHLALWALFVHTLTVLFPIIKKLKNKANATKQNLLEKQKNFFVQIKNLGKLSLFRKNSLLSDKILYQIDALPTVEDFKKQTNKQRKNTLLHINAIIENFIESSIQDIEKRLLNKKHFESKTEKETSLLYFRTVRIFSEVAAKSFQKLNDLSNSPRFSNFINRAS